MWPFKKKERFVLFSTGGGGYYNGNAWIHNESGARRYSRDNVEALKRDFLYVERYIVTVLEV